MPSPAPLSVASVLEGEETPAFANRREARAALNGPSRGRRFIATLPHQAAAAAAATGLVAAAMWQPAVADGGPKELKPDRAAKTAVTAKDVKAAPAEGDSDLQVASVKAEAGVEDRLVNFMKAVENDAATLAPTETKGLLSQPLTSVRITSPFGGRADPWGGGGSVGHIGQDYGVKCGTPVYAAAAGTVTQAEDTQGHSGIRVTIDHGNGLETTYNHNSGLKVKVGDVVNRGDVVSLSGTTGNSTGCHLHLEVVVNKKPVDPAFWL
ncbi:M23 family peptidase [Galactobacter caseinivorans]|uniref:M23 family peptidase n=2 Tax=Galactobacter caseinivorans TaxID=2676123 RepID=A0A496PFM5_9MICC|nr:M23 family peptidase [Galactobacter caseinivorans]